MRTSTLIVAAPLVLALAGGCSFVFSEGPPAGHQSMKYFDCTPGSTPALLDAGAALLFAISATRVATVPDDEWNETQSGPRSDALAIPIGAAVISAGSALYGYATASRCRYAKREWAARLYGPGLIAPR